MGEETRICCVEDYIPKEGDMNTSLEETYQFFLQQYQEQNNVKQREKHIRKNERLPEQISTKNIHIRSQIEQEAIYQTGSDQTNEIHKIPYSGDPSNIGQDAQLIQQGISKAESFQRTQIQRHRLNQAKEQKGYKKSK